MGLAGKHLLEDLRQLFKRHHLINDFLQMPRVQIGGESLPEFGPDLMRAAGGIDAE